MVSEDKREATYSVTDAVDQIGVGRYQLFVFLVNGLVQISDAMEMLLLSFVGPSVRCEWDLPAGADGAIASAVFVGFLFGSPIWGYMADKYGRKNAVLAGSATTFVTGLMSAFSPDLMTLIIARGFTGFALANAALSFTYYAEVLPSKGRGFQISIFAMFWSIGCLLETLLAWAVLESLGWRWLVVLSTVPIGVAALLTLFMDDTPHSLHARGRHEECQQVLRRMADTNGADLPAGTLQPVDSRQGQEEKSAWSSFGMMFSAELCFTTMLVMLIFFGSAFGYYGAVLLSTELMADAHGESGCDSMVGGSLSPLTDEDFGYVVFNTMAEFPGPLLMIVLIDVLGRIRLLALYFLLGAVGFVLLFLPLDSRNKSLFLFIARTSIGAAFNLIYVYAAEVYPTRCRSTAAGFHAAFARFGGMSAPLVGQTIYQLGYHTLAFATFLGVSLGGAGCSLALPIETTGLELEDASNSKASPEEVQPLKAAAS